MRGPFLIPDDFRAFMRQVVRYLDAPSDAPKLLDAEDALQDQTGYGGRIEGGAFRFTYLSPDGREKWVLQLAEAAVRDIADGLLIEVMGERVDMVRTTHREPKGQPLLIWGAREEDALLVRDRVELLQALDALHALARGAPRMLRMWSATDDQIVAMMWRDVCALYVIASLDGYATSCGDAGRTDAFELVDYDGQAFAVPFHDCVPWPAARGALLHFVERGDLGPEIRIEGRVPTGLLMMGDADRGAVLDARVAPPHLVAHSSLPRMLAPPADDPASRWSETTLDEAVGFGGRGPLEAGGGAPAEPGDGGPLETEEAAVWAYRLLDLLHASALIELGPASRDEIAHQLGGLLRTCGLEVQHSLPAAAWLAGELGAVRGIVRVLATPGDLLGALRRTRTR